MRKEHKIKIIYEDKKIIVIDKEPNLLCISDGHEKYNTLYHKVHNYLISKNSKVFIVHRLDKETSGVILFAKDENTKYQYQNSWDSIAVNREYIAIVSGKVLKHSDMIINYINEDKNHKSYIDPKNGKKCITKYEVLEQYSNYSVLKVTILTGRKNQIRLSLASIGHPILGDRKYGQRQSSIRRLCLHAYKLEIEDPSTHQRHVFVSKIPSNFYVYIKRKLD